MTAVAGAVLKVGGLAISAAGGIIGMKDRQKQYRMKSNYILYSMIQDQKRYKRTVAERSVAGARMAGVQKAAFGGTGTSASGSNAAAVKASTFADMNMDLSKMAFEYKQAQLEMALQYRMNRMEAKSNKKASIMKGVQAGLSIMTG